MEIEISGEVLKNIQELSKQLGLKEKELILRAIKIYLRNLEEQAEFDKELNMWERAAIEDSINFEKQI